MWDVGSRITSRIKAISQRTGKFSLVLTCCILNGMEIHLLETKFHKPAPRPDFVRRLRLIDKLNRYHQYALTLISAPAGFGKTTLVGCWLASLTEQTAWISLDENENDPTSFFAYFFTACSQFELQPGRTCLEMLQSVVSPPNNELVSCFINDLIRTEQKFILVLDDYHWIKNPEIHAALTFLLDNTPPNLHLVIISRTEISLPVARLRSKNQLLELTEADLRFTWAEAETFLNQTMGLGLSGEQITDLKTKTEGWITGLQLAALSLQNRTDAGCLVNTISGDSRYVADLSPRPTRSAGCLTAPSISPLNRCLTCTSATTLPPTLCPPPMKSKGRGRGSITGKSG